MAREIELLQEEILELTEAFNELNRTVVSTTKDVFGRQADTVKQANKLVDQFGRAITQDTKATEANTQATKDATKKTEQMSAAQAAANKELKEFEKGQRSAKNYVAELARAQYEAAQQSKTLGAYFERLAGENKDYHITLIKARAALAAMAPLGKGFVDLGKALYEGKQGASANNAALEGLGEAADKLFSNFGIAGAIVGKFIRLFTGYVAEINKMSDRLFKSYQDLSKVGVSAEDGMIGLAESARRLGLGLDETGVENFTRIMKDAATGLALMSGSAAQGRRDFVDFASEVVRGSAGRELMNLGMRVEEINEGLADYVNLQSRVGQTQNKTTSQLASGATAYLREMDLLTKLTGQQRKEMEDRIKRSRAIEQFRAKTEKMRRSGDERQIRAALQAEQTFGALAASGAEEAAQGFAENFSGFISTDAGRRFGQLTGFQMDMAEQFISGELDATRAFGRISRAADEAVTGIGGDLGLVGAASEVYGNFSQLADLAQFAGRNFEDAGDMQRRIQEEMAKGPGGVAAQTDMRRAQMDTRDAFQNLVLAGVQPATSAMAGFAQVVGKVTQALGGPAPKMGAAPGTVGVFGGGGAGAGGGGGAGAGGGGAGGGGGARPGAGGARMFQGGVFGAIESAITLGKGFGSYGAEATAEAGSQRKILDFIGNIESRGNYNVLVGGKTKSDPPLTDMTIGQVLDFQTGMKQMGHESTAVGKYQIIRSTLAGLFQQGVVGYSDKFDAATQDKLAIALMKRRGYDKFQQGTITADQYADSLAKEWASLPMGNGQSAYAGTGSNKALVSRNDFISAISAQAGGVFAGPKSGYAATLHGTEAVVPLPDGKTIPVEMPNLDRNMEQQVSMLGAQLVALEELVRYMRDNNAISTRILQAANN